MLLAETGLNMVALEEILEGTEFGDRVLSGGFEHPAEVLAEFAGRSCYESWSLPNPATATVEGYFANITAQRHFSIMEHASFTLYVTGVSRSLLAELTRHRHLSFSVLSQRFVDSSTAEFVVPPALRDDEEAKEDLAATFGMSLQWYTDLVERLESKGLGRKQAREAARSVLPNMTETKISVTGNHRAWREVIEKRDNPHADAEIHEFAAEVLRIARTVAPNLYQDFA